MSLTIPDIVESEEVLSVNVIDSLTYSVVIGLGDTAVRLMRAGANGEELPLVVLTTDAQIVALDSVYIAGFSSLEQPAAAQLTLAAGAVRYV